MALSIRTRGYKTGLWITLCCLAMLVVACPGFEDHHTGTYHEIDFGEEQDEVVAVEFYRFGGNAKAMLRFYKRTALSAIDAPFAAENQTRCVWTKADAFDEDARKFRLTIPVTARRPRAVVSGSFDEDGLMSARIVEEGFEEQARELRFVQTPARINPRCDTIDDFLIHADFEQESNSLDPERHQIKNPVLAIMWAGVEAVQKDGATIYVAFNRPEPAIRLDPGRHFQSSTNQLRNTLSLSVPPPGDRILVRSGSTRYALAHFVVIDDRESQGRFSWDVREEPIVATSLQSGRREDAPPGTNGWGKALLFVEGQLDELDADLQIRLDVAQRQGEIADSHFHIVDIFYYNDEVVSVYLPDRPQPRVPAERRVPLQVTEAFLDADEILLPRLFPYN